MSNEIEMDVLGAAIADPAQMQVIAEILRPEHFFYDGNRTLYKVMLEMLRRGHSTDMVSLLDELRSRGILEAVGGASHIHAMFSSAPAPVMVEHHARRVFEKAQVRSLVNICNRTLRDINDGAETTDKVLHDLLYGAETIAEGLVTAAEITTAPELVDRYVEDVIRRKEGKVTTISTGIGIVDHLTGGYQEGDLVIWAARANIGKTKLLTASCVDCVRRGIPVGVISMDMSWRRYARYAGPALASAAGDYMNVQNWDDPVVSVESVRREYQALRPSIEYGRNLFIVPDPARSIGRVHGYVRKLSRLGCRVIAIDQAQNFAEYKQTDRGEVSEVVKACKDMARNFNVCIILLHQINRAGADKPQLQHLKDSGSFEEYSDTVILLHDIERALLAQHGHFVEDNGRIRAPKNSDWKEDAEVTIFDSARNPRKVNINVAKTRNGSTDDGDKLFNYERGVFE